uniref:Armadillo repeat containing 4 n=2 Tax=Nothobranchius kuhntae TaxID=321403 RepID=A0A1A8JHW6_NOTKU
MGTDVVQHFSETSSESEDDEEPKWFLERKKDLAPEFLHIQKLVRILKAGDQMATVLVIVALLDLDWTNETFQLALQDTGGLQILVNLLDTGEERCMTGSLKLLRELCQSVQMRQTVVDLGGLQHMVMILDSGVQQLKALAAVAIANAAQFRRARRTVRKHNGIKKLVKMLSCVSNSASLKEDQEKDGEVAYYGVLALWSLSKSSKNKKEIYKAGGIPLLGRLLRSPNGNMLIPVMGILQECASEENCQAVIQTEDLVKDFVRNLHKNNDELQTYCANSIFKCAADKQTCDLVRKLKGLQPLISLLSKRDNKKLLAAVTGAIWKCSASTENVAIFQEHNTQEVLIALLAAYQPDDVLVNVAGALGEFVQMPVNRAAIVKGQGMKLLINLLNDPNQVLLVNVTKVIGACATDEDSVAVIEQFDGVRLVWSLLKVPNEDVQASAAWALSSCINNAKDAAEIVKSLISGLYAIIDLLNSPNNTVLASICAIISAIAKDKENLGALSSMGLVPSLARLADTADDQLRRYLAEAIGRCCNFDPNIAAFGEAGVIVPLVTYLKQSEDISVHHYAAMALSELSWDPKNLITMHKAGVVKPMTTFMASDDEELQMFAAKCVKHIRLLASQEAKMSFP